MLARKQVFIAYPNESSPSFQKPYSIFPQDLSLVFDEFQDNLKDPPKVLPPLRGIVMVRERWSQVRLDQQSRKEARRNY